MSDTIISVENLGKKYTIRHANGKQSYTTFRDVLAHNVQRLFRKDQRPEVNGHAANLRAATNRNDSSEDFWAIKDVSFEVKRGDVLGIIGRNGAGKSTLLKILSRITEQTTGRVHLRGRVASLLEVGTGFHPELTGRENVFLNGSILGMSRAEIRRKFDEIVAFAEVEKFLDTPVKRYSSGMYVRLAFAVAAHLDPEILIVDEVLAVGDAAFQAKCLGKMNKVAKGGRTVIFVSHTMTAVVQLCNRAILLGKGQIILSGDTAEVVGAYLADASVSTNGEFDLTKHPSRSSQSKCIIRKIRLCKENGVTTAHLYPDEPCCVEIEYELTEPLRSPRWAIAVEDYQGRRIMTFASYFQENALSEMRGRGKLQCEIGPLDLGTGRYLLSVSVADKTMGMIDSLDNAAWFEIGWNNNFRDGEPYFQIYGPVLRRSNWKSLIN